MANLLLTLNNQLFSPEHIKTNYKSKDKLTVFLKEDYELLNYHQFHKHRTILYISGLRTYKAELETKKYDVDHYPLANNKESIETTLLNSIKKNKIKKVYFYEIEDKFIEKRIFAVLTDKKIDFEVWP